MSNARKMIAPRTQTPAPGVPGRTGAGCLPEELLSEQVRRLAVFAAVGGGLWTYGLLMDTIVHPRTLGSVVPMFQIVIEILAIATSVAMFLYVPYRKHTPQTKSDVGLVYYVVNAMGVALLNSWAGMPGNDPMHLSWNTVTILVSSMILPATPKKMLVASILAASTDPFGVWLAHLRGLPVPSVVTTVVSFMPNYACAVVAVLPPHLLHALGRRLRHAQEMGSYHLVELLGRGGMGEVWRGEHRLLKRPAAIKLVRPELLGAHSDTESRNMLLRFEREAQATAALSSPHTIRLFDFGVTSDHTFYYVMELLAGRDLESLVREFGPAPADRAVFLLRQACHSLGDAHARGLVHRDVTPANIYVCRMGLEYDFVKVLDFGLVKLPASAAIATQLTEPGITAGTPAFMAPEIALARPEIDGRADLYSLGCVAYYLLTGQLVFDAESPLAAAVAQVNDQPVPPGARSPFRIPSRLEAVILQCLAKDPAARPPSAAALANQLAETVQEGAWTADAARAWWDRHTEGIAV
jgi:eukaryotic-like serine/threonine-protein kinase